MDIDGGKRKGGQGRGESMQSRQTSRILRFPAANKQVMFTLLVQ